MTIESSFIPGRHAELVSASIVQQMACVTEKWTLKRVQGDGVRE